MNKTLKNCAIAGIISAILIIPLIIFQFLKEMGKFNATLTIGYFVLTIGFLTIGIYFMWGFIIIGEKTKNKLLVISSYIWIILTVIMGGFDLLFQNKTPMMEIIFGLAVFILIGGASIPFGIGVLKLKKKFGALATAVGVLNIITGVSLLTIILFFIGLLLIIPLTVLEIILMFKAAEKLK